MFIFLIYFLLNMKFTLSTIIIQGSGVYDIKADDIAMIFYLTVENSYNREIHVSVCFVKCIEGDPYAAGADHMFLLGGDMGYLPSKSITNLTLIYPNLFLHNRIGKCLISLHYDNGEQAMEEMRKEVYFNTDKCFEITTEKCPSFDMDGTDCYPVDCVIKYSSRRSFYNREYHKCQFVPECPPNTVYNPKSNTCRKLHAPVCLSDLEMLEDGIFEKCHQISNVVNFQCHHGWIDNETMGSCICEDGWTTATCSESVYHPTLNVYHMCNVGVNSWERANREKMLMTALAILIFALAIAAKMLLAVCILHWCCRFCRKKKRNGAESICSSSTCPYNYCGDELCEGDGDKGSRTIRVSFSNIGESSGDETDVSVSVAESRAPTSNDTRSTLGSCHCHRK